MVVREDERDIKKTASPVLGDVLQFGVTRRREGSCERSRYLLSNC